MYATGTSLRDVDQTRQSDCRIDGLSDRSLRVAGLGTRGIPSRYSGLETSCEGLYAALVRRGHRMTVYCRAGHLLTNANHHRGIELLRAPAVRLRSLETLSHVGASLVDAAGRRRFDLIHLHAEAPGLFAPLVARAEVAVVATVQGLDWQRAKWKGSGSRVIRRAEELLVRYADEIIVVSQCLQEYFRERYRRTTTFVPNGVEESGRVAGANAILRRWGLAADRYFAFVARLVPEKRAQDLIRAFRSINTPLRLAIVGEGAYCGGYVSELRRLANGDSRIVFTGAQAGEPLDALFQNAVAYVLPSELEGLPMALLECMSHGTPAVVSDIPPHRELLGGIRGYDLFFPPRNVRALAERLCAVASSADGYRSVASRARDHVRAEYGWDLRARETEEVFRRAVTSKRAPDHRGRSYRERVIR